MKIACIQVDGKMPNLALMKIASYYRSRGDEVIRYLSGDVDKVFISVIWPENKAKAIGISKMINVDCEIGGSGTDINKILPNDVEHSMPAYDLWNIDYSIGFTSRGCIRKCDFCIVPKKEGRIKPHSTIEEFHYQPHKKIVLLDNNLLAAPNWRKTLNDIQDRNLKASFCQGLDIRLINEENASVLADIQYSNLHFNSKQLYFAFDDINIANEVRNGVDILLNAGISSRELMFYVLVGFNSTFEEDLERYRILWEELDTWPFIMLFNKKKDPTLRQFARWVNRRIHKSCTWEDYEYGSKKAGEVMVRS